MGSLEAPQSARLEVWMAKGVGGLETSFEPLGWVSPEILISNYYRDLNIVQYPAMQGT